MVIAPSRSAAYRRFYLYSALSVAVIAIAVAGVVLLRLLLQAFGWGFRPPANDVSRNVSLAVALLVIAVPLGGAHLWVILRSFADPAERAAGVRHQYLNLWVAFALAVVLFAGQAAFAANAADPFADVTIQLSILIGAAIVGAIAAWWITRTPAATPDPRIRSAVVVMLVAIAVASFSVANAASSAGGLFQGARLPVTPPRYQESTLLAGLLTAGLALTVWSVAFSWQRRWIASRDRLAYALLGYGLGTAILLIAVAYLIAGALHYARDASRVGDFTGPWSAVVAGSLLVLIHATLLLGDRGRNGHPPVTTTRLLLAFPALVGLGLTVGGLGLGWHALLERDIVTVAHLTDDLTTAAALTLIGLAAYAPAWRSLNARTTAESSVRRFYLFTVVCLALVGGLISSVVALYNAITVIAGVADKDAALTAMTAILPAVLLGAIFATHLVLLLRDQRLTRAAEHPVSDGLLALLEDVHAGRVSVESAAATIRRRGA